VFDITGPQLQDSGPREDGGNQMGRCVREDIDDGGPGNGRCNCAEPGLGRRLEAHQGGALLCRIVGQLRKFERYKPALELTFFNMLIGYLVFSPNSV